MCVSYIIRYVPTKTLSASCFSVFETHKLEGIEYSYWVDWEPIPNHPLLITCRNHINTLYKKRVTHHCKRAFSHKNILQNCMNFLETARSEAAFHNNIQHIHPHKHGYTVTLQSFAYTKSIDQTAKCRRNMNYLTLFILVFFFRHIFASIIKKNYICLM